MTQEIFLARNVLILLGRESFKLPDLVQAMNNFEHPDLLSGFSDCTFARFAETVNDPEKIRSRTLINLVDEFRDKECEIPRDRIYSLLSLCSDFQHPQVDYDQPSEDLAFDVLKRSDEPLCTCSALLIAQTLRLDDQHHQHVELSDQAISFIEFDVRGLRFDRHAMLCNDQIHSWGHYKLIGTDMFGHDQLFSEFCPAFETLMDTLQAHAMDMDMNMDISTPLTKDDSTSSRKRSTPFILKMMDDQHKSAMLQGFGPALTIKTHDTNPDHSTVKVALWLLANLIPQSIPLCPRVAHRKEKARESDEMASTYDQDSSAYPAPSMHLRESTDRWTRNTDVHRIDSADPGKAQEDEGPVSRLRLVRTMYTSG